MFNFRKKGGEVPLAEATRIVLTYKKWSQSKLADVIGTSQTEISFIIIRGFEPRSPQKVDKIMTLYNEIPRKTRRTLWGIYHQTSEE